MKNFSATMQHPLTMEQYGVRVVKSKTGSFAAVTDFPAGAQLFPNAAWRDTAEAANTEAKRIASALEARGLVRVGA